MSKLKQLGIKEAITHKFQEDEFQLTYQLGCEPIDGIFISDLIQITTRGYLPFREAMSDYRAI